jgi:hypothetical protein
VEPRPAHLAMTRSRPVTGSAGRATCWLARARERRRAVRFWPTFQAPASPVAVLAMRRRLAGAACSPALTKGRTSSGGRQRDVRGWTMSLLSGLRQDGGWGSLGPSVALPSRAAGRAHDVCWPRYAARSRAARTPLKEGIRITPLLVITRGRHVAVASLPDTPSSGASSARAAVHADQGCLLRRFAAAGHPPWTSRLWQGGAG